MLAYYNLGIALNHQERYKEAISSYKTALKLSPIDSDIYYNLAMVYKNNG